MKYAVLLCFVAYAAAHVCTLSPLQRLPMNDINVAATPDCGLTPAFNASFSAPCGGRAAQTPTVAVNKGSDYLVLFQKNEQHYTPSNPGNFTIAFSNSVDNPDFKVLDVVVDTNTSTGYIYETMVTLPDHSTAHGILQVIYYTNAPQPGPFYQCSDITLA